MEKSQDARGVCGVGPAESTGKPRSRYCPGGIRALVSLCWRRPRNPREKKPSLMWSPPDLFRFSHYVHHCTTRLGEGLQDTQGKMSHCVCMKPRDDFSTLVLT